MYLKPTRPLLWDRTFGVQAWETRHQVSDLNTSAAIQPARDTAFVLGRITELLTNYGTIDLFVTDGWAWQMGQQALSQQTIREHVKPLQPDIVIIDHGALLVPFLGDTIYLEPLGVSAPTGNTYAAAQGQTIGNGWFWHPSTPTESLMGKDAILSHLADLEPKYTSFTLNCPPNRNGSLDANVVARLAEVGEARNPNLSMPPLPPQLLRAEHPVNPVGAYATGFHERGRAQRHRRPE